MIVFVLPVQMNLHECHFLYSVQRLIQQEQTVHLTLHPFLYVSQDYVQALTGLCYDGVEGLIYLVLFSFVTALMFSSIVCSVPHTWQSKRWEGKGQKRGGGGAGGQMTLNAAPVDRQALNFMDIELTASHVCLMLFFHNCSFCFHILIIFSWLCSFCCLVVHSSLCHRFGKSTAP